MAIVVLKQSCKAKVASDQDPLTEGKHMSSKMNSKASPTASRTTQVAVAAALVVSLGAAWSSPAGAAAKKKTKTTKKVTVANGKTCSTKGTVSASFTCVELQSKALQWWSAGTAQNPLKLGQVGRVSNPASGTWEITVVKRIDDDTARILAIDETNRVATATNTIASLEVRVKNVGTQEFSVRATAFEAASPSREKITRWELGQGALEDCWRDERVAAGAEKVCQFPFEITPGTELLPLRLAVRGGFGIDAGLYFDTATAQPPLK